MKVSEEIDALQAMGFDPVRWLVVPRCLALVIVTAAADLGGNLLALFGGLAASSFVTDMPPRAYILATGDAITAGHLLGGLFKTPFLALAIGLIACGQGLAAQGGAAAVGARTTSAVVLAIFGVIVVQRDVHLPLRIPRRLTCGYLRPRPRSPTPATSSSTICESAGGRGSSWSM